MDDRGWQAVIDLTAAHLIGIGGAVGAVLRYGVGLTIADEGFPRSTFTVNVMGTFVLGLITFAGAGHRTLLLVGTGGCGAFTTFSSFSVTTVERWESGERGVAAAHALGTLVAAGGALGTAWFLSGFF